MAWQNATAESGGERVVVQALGADYRGMGAPRVVSQNITGQNDLNPAVAALPDGQSVVVWESGPRSSRDIFIRILDAQGQFQSDIQSVNSFQAGVQSDAAVAALSGGDVLVVWASDGQDGSGEGVYGQRFSQTGAKVGSEFRVSQTTSQNQSRPAVVAVSSSQFVVAWVGESVAGRNSSGAPNLRRNVLARFIGVSDTAGNEFQLNEGDVVATEVSLAALSAGGFVAAWTQRDEVSSRNITEVFARQYGSNGLPSGEAQRVNTFLPGAQDSPVLAAVNAGVMMAWSSFGQDAGGLGVRGRLLSGGAEFGVNAQENLDQSMPALASDGGQQLLAVWANTIRADHSILSAQRYVLHDGSNLPAATDLSAGAVEVVGNEPVQRQTNPSVVAERERAAALKAQQTQNIAGTATLQVTAAPQPVGEPATPPPPLNGGNRGSYTRAGASAAYFASGGGSAAASAATSRSCAAGHFRGRHAAGSIIGADARLAERLHRGTQCLGRAYSAISGGRSGAAAVGLHAVLYCAGSPICLCGIFRGNIAYALEHVVGQHLFTHTTERLAHHCRGIGC